MSQTTHLGMVYTGEIGEGLWHCFTHITIDMDIDHQDIMDYVIIRLLPSIIIMFVMCIRSESASWKWEYQPTKCEVGSCHKEFIATLADLTVNDCYSRRNHQMVTISRSGLGLSSQIWSEEGGIYPTW